MSNIKAQRYYDLCEAEKGKRSNNDCAVIALALATKISYEDAEAAYELAGRKDNRGVSLFQIESAMRVLDVDFNEIAFPLQANGSRFTNVSISKKYNKGHYIVTTDRHAFALIDGQVEDYSYNRRTRVTYVYEINA